MKWKNIFVKALALTATVFLTGNSMTVYGETENTNNTGDTEQNTDKDNGQAPDSASVSDHKVHELDKGIVVPPTCTEKGYTLYKCMADGCDYTIKKDEKDPLGHDMKEISRTEATDGEPEKIVYECQREGCSYQETVNTAEHSGDSKDVPKDPAKPEPSRGPELSVTPEPTVPGKPDNTDKENPSEEETETESDTEDDSQSYSFSISTDIITEYDPETAYSTMKAVHKPDTVDETENIEGRTVPEDTVDITRDDDGNLTDLSVSTELKEIENGFSVISEAETLRSVTVVNRVNPGAYWITLKSKSPAGEMGIHLKHTKTGVTVTLTENKKLLHITRVTENAKNIILHTSSGGTCEIRKDERNFTADELNISGEQMDQIFLRDLKSNAPKIGFASSDTENDKEDKNVQQYKEKDYWLLPYDEQEQEPVVITIYEKIKDTY